MAPVRWNVIVLGILFALASMVFSIAIGFGGPDEDAPHYSSLHKAGFLVAITLAPAFLSAGLTLAKRAAADRAYPLFNLTVLILVLCALFIVGTAAASLELAIFTDMVIEGVMVGLASSGGGLVMAFTHSDATDDD